MIRPSGVEGVAFTETRDGDIRNDPRDRRRVAEELGIDLDWATVAQMHGSDVLPVDTPGEAGGADALWTATRGLPLAVFTADCFGVVLHGPGVVGVAHAGWRGAHSGVIGRLMSTMASAGLPPLSAFVGPGIRSCCFEVGDEVLDLFEGFRSQTTWGTASVDLAGAIRSQLEGLEVWDDARCTMHEASLHSHRATATSRRAAAIGWLP